MTYFFRSRIIITAIKMLSIFNLVTKKLFKPVGLILATPFNPFLVVVQLQKEGKDAEAALLLKNVQSFLEDCLITNGLKFSQTQQAALDSHEWLIQPTAIIHYCNLMIKVALRQTHTLALNVCKGFNQLNDIVINHVFTPMNPEYVITASPDVTEIPCEPSTRNLPANHPIEQPEDIPFEDIKPEVVITTSPDVPSIPREPSARNISESEDIPFNSTKPYITLKNTEPSAEGSDNGSEGGNDSEIALFNNGNNNEIMVFTVIAFGIIVFTAWVMKKYYPDKPLNDESTSDVLHSVSENTIFFNQLLIKCFILFIPTSIYIFYQYRYYYSYWFFKLLK